MNQEFRSTQMLLVTALLLSAVAIAQPGTNDCGKSTEHHSKFSKVAFWRHHNDANKNPKHDQSGTAQVKQAAAKESQASKMQVKAVTAKQSAGKISQNQNTTKPATDSAKKTTAKASSAQLKKSPQKSMTAQNTQQKNSSAN